jgi:hypothetical protein
MIIYVVCTAVVMKFHYIVGIQSTLTTLQHEFLSSKYTSVVLQCEVILSHPVVLTNVACRTCVGKVVSVPN